VPDVSRLLKNLPELEILNVWSKSETVVSKFLVLKTNNIIYNNDNNYHNYNNRNNNNKSSSNKETQKK